MLQRGGQLPLLTRRRMYSLCRNAASSGAVLLLLLPLYTVHADSHTLQLSFTTLNKRGQDAPWYSIVGMLDGAQIVRYDNSVHEAQPLYDWMRDPVSPQFWEENTELAQKYQQDHWESLQHLQKIVNQSADVHTYQIKYHCELYDDGSIGGHTDFGYNGRDYIFFDKDSLTYIPATSTAQILTQKWNRDRTITGNDKEFAERHCIDWIDKYSKILRESLKTAARPEVKVWGRQQPDGVTRLQCLAYGFHPRAVDVKWVRNGEDHIPSDEASPILPHPDGTYQTRVSVEVPTREGDTYSCHVDHSSLEETLTVNLTELDFGVPKHTHGISMEGSTFKAGNKTYILLAAALLLVLTISVVYFYVVKTCKLCGNNEKKSDTSGSAIRSECMKALDFSLLDEEMKSQSQTAIADVFGHHTEIQRGSYKTRTHIPDLERRAGNVLWCRCANCEIMKSEEESKCCYDYKELHGKLVDSGCIIDDHEFQQRCLDEDILSLNIPSSRLESSQLSQGYS